MHFEYRFRSLLKGILKFKDISIFKRDIYIKIQMQISILKFKISVLYFKIKYRLLYFYYIDICIYLYFEYRYKNVLHTIIFYICL